MKGIEETKEIEGMQGIEYVLKSHEEGLSEGKILEAPCGHRVICHIEVVRTYRLGGPLCREYMFLERSTSLG